MNNTLNRVFVFVVFHVKHEIFRKLASVLYCFHSCGKCWFQSCHFPFQLESFQLSFWPIFEIEPTLVATADDVCQSLDWEKYNSASSLSSLNSLWRQQSFWIVRFLWTPCKSGNAQVMCPVPYFAYFLERTQERKPPSMDGLDSVQYMQ